jgi:hypothetical protein
MKCNISGKPSPVEAWNLLSYEDRRHRLSLGTLAANDTLYDLICTNFNPTFCLQIILTLVGYGAKILDPSAGWGDRLIAALAALANYYMAVDPNTELQEAYRKIAETLGPLAFPGAPIAEVLKRYRVTPKYFETVNFENSKTFREFFNIAITSPPYFTYEEYHNSRRDLDYDQWITEVYRPYLANMFYGVEVGGYIVIYVGDFAIDHTPFQMSQDTLIIMDEYVQQGRLRLMAPFGFQAVAGGKPSKVRIAHCWLKLAP